MKTFSLPTLYREASSGAVQQWTVSVAIENDIPVILVEYGKVGGKKKIDRQKVHSGKNIGRSNETTPYEQAVSEATSRWNRKKDREAYDENIVSSRAKRAVKPMLAHVYEKHSEKVDWSKPVFVQPKLDGHRCLAFKDNGRVSLLSRRGTAIDTLPHIVSDLNKTMEDGQVFDGELYCHTLSLNQIGSLIKKASDESELVEFHCYDVVENLPFSSRMALLLVDFGPSLRAVETKRVYSEEEASEQFALFVEDGYEGAMLRHGDDPYKPGARSTSLLKLKSFQDSEFVIIGYREGKGTCEGMAVFYCQTDAGHRFEVLAPGTHEQKKEAWENRDSFVGKYVTVKYQYLTNTATPVPFPAVAKCIRDDV